jgi:hypothetical protein
MFAVKDFIDAYFQASIPKIRKHYIFTHLILPKIPAKIEAEIDLSPLDLLEMPTLSTLMQYSKPDRDAQLLICKCFS